MNTTTVCPCIECRRERLGFARRYGFLRPRIPPQFARLAEIARASNRGVGWTPSAPKAAAVSKTQRKMIPERGEAAHGTDRNKGAGWTPSAPKAAVVSKTQGKMIPERGEAGGGVEDPPKRGDKHG
jgi:hypothetical protein